MIGTYGTAKIGVSTITDANVQYLRDTDLGLPYRGTKSENEVPAKGTIATMDAIATANQGGGYSSGTKQPITGIMTSNNGGENLFLSALAGENDNITFSATGGTGSGATFTGTTIYRIGHMVANLPLSFGSATTLPTTTVDGSTAGISGVAANGALANFIVKARGNTITEVIVEEKTPAGADGQGTGYIIGEAITISKAAMDADGSLGVVSGPITVFPTIDHVTNGANIIKVLNGGSGYTVGDTLSLTQISPAQKGTPIGDSTGELATADVATLGGASTVITAPNNIYPRGIKTSTGTEAAPKTIEFVGLDDVNVIIGGFTAGTVLPLRFKQVIDAGTDELLGNLTILY